MNTRDRLERDIQSKLSDINLRCADLEKAIASYKFREDDISQDSIRRHAVNLLNLICKAVGLDGLTLYRSHPKWESEIQCVCHSFPEQLTGESEVEWWQRYLNISDSIMRLPLKDDEAGDPLASQFAFNFPDYPKLQEEVMSKMQFGTKFRWITISGLQDIAPKLAKRTMHLNKTLNLDMHLQSSEATDGTSFSLIFQSIRYVDPNISKDRRLEIAVSDEILIHHLLAKHQGLFMDLAQFLEFHEKTPTVKDAKLSAEAQALVDEAQGYDSAPTAMVGGASGVFDLQRLFDQNELILSLLGDIAGKPYRPVILDGKEIELLVGN